MPHRAIASWTLLACLLGACDRTRSSSGGTSAVDLSSPKAALKTYGRAMKDGDIATARQAVTGANPKAIEALAELGASRNRLREAAVAKFGDAGKNLAGAGEASYGERFDKMLDEAEVRIDGDLATVAQKPTSPSQTQPTPGADPPPLKLKRIDGSWKVDYAAMPDTRNLDLMLPLMRGMIKVNDEIAGQIKAGKYAAAEEAENAHFRLMNAVLRPESEFKAPVASQPAGASGGGSN